MARNKLIATIASGAAISNVVQGNGATLVGLYIPAGYPSTTVKFNAYTASGTTEGAVSDGAGGVYTKTISSGVDQYVDLSADLFTAGIDGIQLIAGSNASGAVNIQTLWR